MLKSGNCPTNPYLGTGAKKFAQPGVCGFSGMIATGKYPVGNNFPITVCLKG